LRTSQRFDKLDERTGSEDNGVTEVMRRVGRLGKSDENPVGKTELAE
jgi:hypothetical protein